MAGVDGFFSDEGFADQLVRLLTSDIKALQDCATLLSPDDFRPVAGMKHGRPRWLLAEMALEYFNKYGEPGRTQMRHYVLTEATRRGIPERQIEEFKTYWAYLRKLEHAPPERLVETTVEFKQKGRMRAAMEELAGLYDSGGLTAERWAEITHNAVVPVSNAKIIDVFAPAQVESAIERRLFARGSRVPWTLIEPLDRLTTTCGHRMLGVVFAPPGRGKSLFLLWLAVAYARQRYKVLYFTLEDPLSQVEDRLHSIITHIAIPRLAVKPESVRRRLQRFRRMVRGHVHIIDGTAVDEGISTVAIQQIAMQQRSEGFNPDVILVDYDDEVAPLRRRDERRHEFADIYRDLRRLAAKNNWIVWTAAQTQRNTEGLKILSGEKLAEDYSKVRKARVAIGIGKGDWGNDSLYLWVAKNNYGKAKLGCHVIPDFQRMLLYDAEATRKAERQHAHDPQP